MKIIKCKNYDKLYKKSWGDTLSLNKKSQDWNNSPYFYTTIPIPSSYTGENYTNVQVGYKWENNIPLITGIVNADTEKNIINEIDKNIYRELLEKVKQRGPDADEDRFDEYGGMNY